MTPRTCERCVRPASMASPPIAWTYWPLLILTRRYDDTATRSSGVFLVSPACRAHLHGPSEHDVAAHRQHAVACPATRARLSREDLPLQTPAVRSECHGRLCGPAHLADACGRGLRDRAACRRSDPNRNQSRLL